MNYTTNFNLYKWNSTDQKLDTINEMSNNMDKIDGQLTTITRCSVTYNGVTTLFSNQTTNLYVAPDSSVVIGNDGLSSAKPIKLSDIQTIFTTLAGSFPMVMGTWTVNLAAGTYQGDGTNHMLHLASVRSSDYIQFNGYDVGTKGNTPTTILDGKTNGTPYMHGMYFENMKVQVKNIKFQNFTEGTTPNIPTGTRAGVAFSGTEGKIYAYNVFAYNCSWGGLINQGIPRLYVEGGRYEYCRYGVMSMYNSIVTIGYNGSSSYPDSQNTNFYNCTESGVQIQSQTNGHVDYCIFDSNTNKCMVIDTASEINSVSSIFRNSNIAVSVQEASRWLNTGCTFTNNTQQFDVQYSGVIKNNTSPDPLQGRSVVQLTETATNFQQTAPSGGGVIYTQTISAQTLNGRGKTLNCIVYGRFENLSTNTSTLNVRLNDGTNNVIVQGVTLGSTTGYQTFKLEFFLSNWTSTAFYYNSDFYSQVSGSLVYNNNAITIDSTKDITLTIELAVTGTAANTGMNIYRTIPRLMQ